MARTVVEMCCGYGGATAGMMAAGLEMEASYDIWPTAVDAHRGWHPDAPCEVRDVATITPEELAGRFVWASLPCQPWSEANTIPAKRGKHHPHYYSLAHFARQVQHARCAIIENVPGLVQRKDGQAELAELERECARLGLTMTVHLVYSHWFGVDQWRKRVFIVIGRNLPLILIQPHASAAPDKAAPTVMASDGLSSSLHRQRRAAAVTCHPTGTNEWSGKKNRCVTTKDNDGEKNGATRGIEECADLQGVPVPPDHLTRKDRYTLVGNAVPPRLAQAIAEQVFVPLLEADS